MLDERPAFTDMDILGTTVFRYPLFLKTQFKLEPGPVAQSVGNPSADPGVVSLILVGSHTFVETDHEIISRVILIQEGLLSVTSESMCMKCWLTT